MSTSSCGRPQGPFAGWPRIEGANVELGLLFKSDLKVGRRVDPSPYRRRSLSPQREHLCRFERRRLAPLVNTAPNAIGG